MNNSKTRTIMKRQIKENHEWMMKVTKVKDQELCQAITDDWNRAMDKLEAKNETN